VLHDVSTPLTTIKYSQSETSARMKVIIYHVKTTYDSRMCDGFIDDISNETCSTAVSTLNFDLDLVIVNIVLLLRR